MLILTLFRNARILLLLLLLTACTPAASITLGHLSPEMIPLRPGIKTIPLADGVGDDVLGSLPPLLPLGAGETRLYATQVALPTYPIERYQSVDFDPTYRWPYLHFDQERFRNEAPSTELRYFELLVLENAYLQVSILPEVGGRIWQVVHKPTGDTMFYQNRVIKPSPWGPASQLGWLAAGGLEWALPVNEHGYDWGTKWNVTTFQEEGGSVGVHIATPNDGRLLAAEIVVSLSPDSAYVTISPTLHNLADHELNFQFWQTAMLAPGPENSVSAELRFVAPSPIMSIHSTGDTMLPSIGQRFTWPRYFGRDLSRLGNWDRYIGFFEYPTAQGPFVGVYDAAVDAGAARIFPAEIAPGSKVFGLGWRNRIWSDDFTDDGSSYVELHGGLPVTFDDPYTLLGNQSVQWTEQWYPVAGIGNLVYADLAGALNLERTADGLRVAFYPTTKVRGTLSITQIVLPDARLVASPSKHAARTGEPAAAELPIDLMPSQPFIHDLPMFDADADVAIQLRDVDGKILFEYSTID